MDPTRDPWLHVDDQAEASGPMRVQIGEFTVCGDGRCVGWDSADPVSSQYGVPFPSTGGKLLDLDLEAAAVLSRE